MASSQATETAEHSDSTATEITADDSNESIQEEQFNNSTGATNTVSNAKHGVRDSSWLELDVCREYLRGDCSRSADECRYAHPTGSVIVKEGKVTCCFDYLKDRCNRDMCKYLHPPTAIKERLVMAGKQYGQAMAVSSKPVLTIPPLSPSNIPVTGSYPVFINTSELIADTPTFTFPSTYMPSYIEVCREFDNNLPCPHGLNCFYAHPEPYVRRNGDDTVTFCWNYMKGYCRHQQCWFYHPPPHIMAALMGSPMLPQMYLDTLMIPSYASTFTKSPYSSPTGSITTQYGNHYHLPLMAQYSPTSSSFTMTTHPPVTGTLPQTIVK